MKWVVKDAASGLYLVDSSIRTLTVTTIAREALFMSEAYAKNIVGLMRKTYGAFDWQPVPVIVRDE